MGISLESEIGGRRFPLWWRISRGRLRLWSLSTDVAPSPLVPIFIRVLPDGIGQDEDPIELKKQLVKAGFQNTTILVIPEGMKDVGEKLAAVSSMPATDDCGRKESPGES